MLAYMLTWTTYGTWLQGDLRGWVKDGKVKTPSDALEKVNHEKLKHDAVYLKLDQRQLVLNAILEKSRQLEHNIRALAVCRNHVHVVADCNGMDIAKVVSYYKNTSEIAVKNGGQRIKLWTKGYDKRYLDTVGQVNEKIEYVLGHTNGIVYKSSN